MGRKKTRAAETPPPQAAEKAFFRPFGGLGKEWLQAKAEDAASPAVQPAAARQGQGPGRLWTDPPPVRPLTEEEAFQRAAHGVKPLKPVNTINNGRPRRGPRAAPVVTEEERFTEYMLELDEDEIRFHEENSGEMVEIYREGFDAARVRELRTGKYAIQGELDVHGLTSAEAREEIIAFVSRCVRDGKSVVKIIHGKGLGSRDGVPVIKELLKGMVFRGPLSRHVLVMTSAHWRDGGAGASYLLIKKSRGGA
ncbi:MAG: hypothetical protein GMKNLPBB_01155 [Myxococcota bacterium]|nr:hypothetical protein [Myxococcota bacterium]